MRSLSVHPVPALRSSDAASSPSQLYRLVPCRPLPAFDPIPSVKRSLLPLAVVRVYDAWFRKTRAVLVPLYCVGLFLRIASNFSPAAATDALALTSAVCLTPLCLISFLDMRRGLVAVLLRSFDFWFLGATSLLWTIALGIAMGPSMQLSTLPAFWMEVVVGVLTDCYLAVRRGFIMISVSVLVSILALMVGVSLGLTSGLDDKPIVQVAPTHFVLSLCDVILNAMATTAIFYARVLFLSVRGICRRQRDPTDTRVHSVLVRCALQWEDGLVLKGPEERPQRVDSADLLHPVTAATNFPEPKRLLQMMLVANPSFEMLAAADTVCRKMSALTHRLHRVLPTVMTALGLIGVTGTVIGLAADFQAPHQVTNPVHSSASAIGIVSITALASTAVYSAVAFASYQRQLLRCIAATFNFVFLSLQISGAHLCLCDVLYWDRDKTLCVVASWLWIHVLLTADSMTPAMKRRLGFKVWHMLPIIVLSIVGQVALAIEIVYMNRWKLQDRVVWATQVHEDWHMEIRSSAVLLGRLATLVVWFLRLLYRLCLRSSDDELILLQGSVEFDYVSWKRCRSSTPGRTGTR